METPRADRPQSVSTPRHYSRVVLCACVWKCLCACVYVLVCVRVCVGVPVCVPA